MTVRRNAARLPSGSTSVTRRSGRRSASARPGAPAPVPTSTTRAPGRDARREHQGVGQHEVHQLLGRARRGEVDARVPLLEPLEPRFTTCEHRSRIHRRAERRPRPARCAAPAWLPSSGSGTSVFRPAPMSARAVPPLPQPVHELAFAPLAALVEPRVPRGARPYARVRADARRRVHPPLLPREALAAGRRLPCSSRTAPSRRRSAKAPRSARWPFLEVRDLLAARGVDVPGAPRRGHVARGWVLLEDLRDDTLAVYLAATPRPSRGALRPRRDGPGSRAARAPRPARGKRRRDARVRRGAPRAGRSTTSASGPSRRAASRSPPPTGPLFDGIAARLARRIAGWPRAFVHRDYQSRNLMVSGQTKRLCWIDFQDALLGPRVYDLVALLNDSYQVFDRAFVEARLDDYARARGLDAAERSRSRPRVRPGDGSAQAQGRRPLRLHRSREGKPVASCASSSRPSPRCAPASRASRTTRTCGRSRPLLAASVP